MVTTRNSKKTKENSITPTKPSTQKKTRSKTTKAEADPLQESSSRKRSFENGDNDTNAAKKKYKGKEKKDIVEVEPAAMEVDEPQDLNEDKIAEEEEDEEEDDDDDEDDDNIDWETIQLPPRFEEQEAIPAKEEAVTYNDVEIVIEAPRPILKKSHWEMAYQRNLRDWTHNCHILMFVAHYKMRNNWCSQSNMMSVCSSVVPDHAKRLLAKGQTESNIVTGIKWLLKWWSEFFTITGPGLSTRPYTDFIQLKDNLTLRALIDKHESDENGDYIENFDSFMKLLSTKLATRDTCAELFVAILRSCGCDTRLVCSLQPLPYKIPPAFSTNQPETEETANDDDDEKSTPVTFKFRTPSKTYVDPNVQLKQPRAKPPTVWAEVYCTDTKKWICIDPIRGHIDKPLLMEPAAQNRSNHISLILAFDGVNSKGRYNTTDVTRRYTPNFEKALRLRERPLTKREKEGGLKQWSEVFLDRICQKNKIGERETIESQELDTRQTNEVMPTAIGNFKNHPLYALERHLKKFEILHPREPVLGSIRGEKIYPRDCVKTLSTADTYRKLGREIKEGEQPAKMVKANAVTIEKRRLKEQAKQEGHDLMVACYGEWQTQPYVSLPVVNGKIPKNAFGNIDLFTPTMLPKGAVHIPIKGIAKLAKELGIDYADAVVDFEFIKMRAVPLIDGIVVAEHSKDILLEAWEEHDQNEAMKAIAKQEKDVYIRWRKLIKGLLIKARVDSDYGKIKQDDSSNNDQIWASFNQKNNNGDDNGGGGGAGGFLPEDD